MDFAFCALPGLVLASCAALFWPCAGRASALHCSGPEQALAGLLGEDRALLLQFDILVYPLTEHYLVNIRLAAEGNVWWWHRIS